MKRPWRKYNFEREPRNTSGPILLFLTHGPWFSDLRGDEWQLDARILKWHGIAFLFGFDTVYRLDRLSGRYRDIAQERTAERTVYSLGEDRGLDLWTIVQKHGRWLPWVDAVYGSATYMPMVDRGSYNVLISTTGLLTRPRNDIAREAVRKWH